MNLLEIEWQKIGPDVFAISAANGLYIVYTPLTKGAFTCNAELVQLIADYFTSGHTDQPSLAAELHESGVLALIEPQAIEIPTDGLYATQPFSPTDVVLLTTNRCNLNCTYCYAAAGPAGGDMPREIADSAVSFVLANAQRLGVPECHIAFHGGGEPALAPGFIRDTVSYARQQAQSVKVGFSIVTNGVIPAHDVEWLAQNMESIQISLDGPPFIHDHQRPTRAGGSSHAAVMQTLRILSSYGAEIEIKATITDWCIPHLQEIIEYLVHETPAKRIHLGAALSLGRAIGTGHREPGDEFVTSYVGLSGKYDVFGRTVRASVIESTFPKLRSQYCGVASPNFAITPDGEVTACHCVLSCGNNRSAKFFYGQYSNGSFSFDAEKIADLQLHRCPHIPQCKDCFAKWSCAGDCWVRWFDDQGVEEANTTNDLRCKLNRALVAQRLFSELQIAEQQQ